MAGNQCGSVEIANDANSKYETIKIEKTRSTCSLCEDYAKQQSSKPIAILSCEGACLRGEVSRQAANKISFQLAPETTVRICLGGAFTKDTGQRDLVRNAQKVVAVEGCLICCASRMMQGVLDGLQPEVIIADSLYDMEGDYFEINDLPEEKIRKYAETVAARIVDRLGLQTA